ncbi:MAG: SpoIIE family protein phosphatase, partial [Bdellovibrionota bacterium]
YEENFRLALKCQELYERLDGIPNSGRGIFGLGGFMLPWVRPLSEAIETLDRVFVQLKRLGDPVISNFVSLYISTLRFQSGEPLIAVKEETKRMLKEVAKSGDSTIVDCLVPTMISCSRLLGENIEEYFSKSADGSSSAFIVRVLGSNVENIKAWYGTQTLMVDTILQDREGIARSLKLAEISVDATPFSFTISNYYLFSSLYYFDEITQGRITKKSIQNKLKVSRNKLKKWAEVNPLTFEPFWTMFQAESYIAEGDFSKASAFYIECIESAMRSGNLLFQAFANERFGRYCLSEKKMSLGYSCLTSSLHSYNDWQAKVKVEQMQAEFPALRMVQLESGLEATSTSNEVVNTKTLDVLSVIKSCQIIGNEMDISKLLSQIVFLLIENAGAEKGHIFLKTNNELFLRATSLGKRPEDVQILNRKLESVDTASLSLVKYVELSHESVIVEDAQINEMVRNDMYVRMAGCKSILCLPILNKGQLLGVIWLENNSATGVFDNQRAEVLELLAAQASISFENARLFDQEQEKMRMEGELRVAQTVQNTLFEIPDGKISDFQISGSIEAASECGGDWWHYGSFGSLNYFCIGDATGHGVSAALITSAVRSAMASVEFLSEISAVQIIRLLNNSVSQTSKGEINMTMFLAVYDKEKNQFTYCNNSHEPTIHIPWEWIEELRVLSRTDRLAANKRFRKEITFLDSLSGPALGAQKSPALTESLHSVQSKDYLFCYTDGLPEMVAEDGKILGERMFINMLAETLFEENEISRMRSLLRDKLRQFRGEAQLKDDVTFFFTQKA